MNREAAALNIPVYSIFRGKIGAVDRSLEKEGRLVMIRTSAEIESKIVFKRRDKSFNSNAGARLALQDIVNHVEDIIRFEYPAGATRKNERDIRTEAST
jgi:hypothetical protein